MKLKKDNIVALVLVILLISVAGGIVISGNDYTVSKQTTGLQGGTTEGGNYTARFILTASDGSGGGPNVGGGNYTANIGVFNVLSNTPTPLNQNITLNSGWNLISLFLSYD